MYVVKRDGRTETVHFDKITARLKKLSCGLNQEHCDPVLVAQKVCAGEVCARVYKGVTTSQLDELAAETAAVPPRLCLSRDEDCGVQPAQEHQEVLLGDD